LRAVRLTRRFDPATESRGHHGQQRRLWKFIAPLKLLNSFARLGKSATGLRVASKLKNWGADFLEFCLFKVVTI
jgi:hypothetical protein